MFDSERNKQNQRVLCNEIRRLPNETIKQLAVRIETLVRKAYLFNTHDYKKHKIDRNFIDDLNTSKNLKKITEILNICEKNPNFKHPSKNGVIIADKTDTVLPNVDKNNKTIRTNLKSTENQISHSIKT